MALVAQETETLTVAALNKPNAPKIGIIYPPAEVRNIVDKTASFVARNGPEFESRIRLNGLNNPKFNFLNPKDPYHAYYQQKVKDFQSGKPQEALPEVIATQSKANQEIPKKIVETFAPKDPPAEFEFVYDPPSITAQDIDIVKLTAQFVARNGRLFLTQLMNREQRNYQFDFLRAQHPMFGYFTSLVEQYTKILIPPKDLMEKLKVNLNDCKKLTDEVKYRVEWQKYEEQQRKKEEEAAEKERVAYALVDWHDFVVVETVDFQPNELGNFPLPTTPDEVGARTIKRERGEDDQGNKETQPNLPQVPGTGIGHISDEEDGLSDQETEPAPPNVTSIKYRADLPVMEHVAEDDMELSDEGDSDDDDTEKPKTSEAGSGKPKSQPNPSQVVIRDYNPKSTTTAKTDDSKKVMLISPFTGERIPADQAPKHVRVGLLDPKWVEQKDKEIRQKNEEDQVFAPGQVISSNLKQLAEKRTDIFGVGNEEVVPGEKEKGESGGAQVAWDGHSDSVAAITRRARDAVTPQQIQAHMEEQQRRQAELSHIGVAMPPAAPLLPPPPQFTMPPPPPPPPPMTLGGTEDAAEASQSKRPKDA